jgi:mannan polymerase II complex MNN11 subunit
MRHAMTLHPTVPFFFYLGPHTLITNPSFALHKHLLKSKTLEGVMLRNRAVVPPDSVIKTYAHINGEDINLVITQDNFGIVTDSFIIRRGDWAKYFLDTWFDPLYRSFNFQKAETHALEHIVQWHPTILTRMAIIPQNLINSYSRGVKEALWKKDDFLINFKDCDVEKGRDCEKELDPYWRPLYGP